MVCCCVKDSYTLSFECHLGYYDIKIRKKTLVKHYNIPDSYVYPVVGTETIENNSSAVDVSSSKFYWPTYSLWMESSDPDKSLEELNRKEAARKLLAQSPPTPMALLERFKSEKPTKTTEHALVYVDVYEDGSINILGVHNPYTDEYSASWSLGSDKFYYNTYTLKRRCSVSDCFYYYSAGVTNIYNFIAKLNVSSSKLESIAFSLMEEYA